MSGGLDVLKLQQDDVAKMLAASTHLGSINSEISMMQYSYNRRPDGVFIIDLRKTWDKLVLAARAIAAIENPADVYVVSSRPFGQRAVLKFARYIGATPIAGRFTPGTFTNQIQAAFREPRLLVVADPRCDHQPVTESSYANIPIIAFCNMDTPTKFVDLAVPCNTTGAHSIGLMWWFLAREVLRLRGSISRDIPWDVMPDLFFFRDPEEADKEEQARLEAQAAAAPAPKAVVDDREGMDNDWTNEPAPGGVPSAVAPAGPMKSFGADDWTVQTTPSDWAAETSGTTEQWGGSGVNNWN